MRFSDKTYENIMQQYLECAPADIDIRQGSIYFDAGAGLAFKLAEFYSALDTMFQLVNLPSATGVYLDDRGAELVPPLLRNIATPAKYRFNYVGVQPALGERFFTNGMYFRLIREDGWLLLEAEEPGALMNNIVEGTPTVPMNSASGLVSASFGEMYIPGIDRETDHSYQDRIQKRIQNPAENGNRSHYKMWAESVEGIGRARIIALWDGDNTVKGVLFGYDGKPALDHVVQNVQEHIDPGRTGLGDGMANIGAFFTAVAATARPIQISFSAKLVGGAELSDLEREATDALEAHFKELALNSPESDPVVLRMSTIGVLLHGLPSILDYANLQINGEARNLMIENVEAPVLEAVVIDEDF